MLCITLKERQTTWFVQNQHSPVTFDRMVMIFFYRTCNVFFICYAVILLQYSKSSRTNSSVYKTNSVFKQFYFFTKDFDNVKLVFIELPIYSIYWWNKYKGHSNPEQFKSDDCIPHVQIDLLNQYIRDFNRIFHEQQCMVCDL